MNTKRTLSFVALTLCVCIASLAKAPKYVFYFIGDGMGLNQVAATQYYLRSCKGGMKADRILSALQGGRGDFP